MIANRAIVTRSFVVLLLCAFCAPHALLRATSETGKIIELTQVDLFSLPDWKSKSVAVNGIVLGMTKSQTTQILQSRGFILLTNTNSVDPCRQEGDFCHVNKVDGPWIGVDLFFDHDRLAKITMMFPDDAVPAVQKVNVTHQFKGLTYKFFRHYSDGLRNQIFGPAEGKERPYDSIPGSTFKYVEYDYPSARVIVLITIDKRDNPPQPFDIELDFVAPRKD